MKVTQRHVLDWQDELGRTPVLHELIMELATSYECGQHSYIGVDREWIDEDDDVRMKILDEVEKLTGERLDKLLITIWW